MTSENRMTWNEALVEYGIGHEYHKRPLRAQLGENQSAIVDNLYAIVRTDTNQPLPGVAVNGRYTPVQTKSYADIGERIVRESGAQFVKGGLLAGGKLAYLQAEMPDTIRLNGTNDEMRQNLTFINSFDGSTCFMILPTLLRVFCANQLEALNRNAKDSGLKFRHTTNVAARLEQADNLLLEAMDAFRAFKVKAEFLADTQFNDAQLNVALAKAFGVKSELDSAPTRTKNNITIVRDNFQSGLGIDASNRGTAWAAYNALTQYSDHQRSLRKGTNEFESGLIGSGSLFKARALAAVEYAVAA